MAESKSNGGGNTISVMKNGFIIVPFRLPETDIYKNPAIHYLYMKKHENKDCAEEANCLFLFNLPILTHLETIKLNFNKILSQYKTQSIYEKVLYLDEFKNDEIKLNELSSDYFNQETDNKTRFLPHNTCLLKFVDSSSVSNCLNSLKKYSTNVISSSSSSNMIEWEGISQPKLSDFTNFYNPLPIDYLKTEISEALTEFENRETQAIDELNNATSLVDEDGFTLVVGKNTKNLNSIKRKLLNKNPLTKFSNNNVKVPRSKSLNASEDAKQNKKVKLDFYRFQIRERKKQEINELLNKFKDDQLKIQEMKQQKRFNPYNKH